MTVVCDECFEGDHHLCVGWQSVRCDCACPVDHDYEIGDDWTGEVPD